MSGSQTPTLQAKSSSKTAKPAAASGNNKSNQQKSAVHGTSSTPVPIPEVEEIIPPPPPSERVLKKTDPAKVNLEEYNQIFSTRTRVLRTPGPVGSY
jgi:hypothetical protein